MYGLNLFSLFSSIYWDCFAQGALVGLISALLVFVADGARVDGVGTASAGLLVAHGARAAGIPAAPPSGTGVRKFWVGAVRSTCEGFQVAGKYLENTKCWTT